MFAQQMNPKFAAIFLFSAMCACCVSCSNDHVDDEPKFDWTLDVDEPIKQLEEILSETSQQQPMNYTSCNLVSLYDVKLALLFHRYVVSLPLAKRAAAISEQDRWEKQTEKAAHDAHIQVPVPGEAGYRWRRDEGRRREVVATPQVPLQRHHPHPEGMPAVGLQTSQA